MERIDVYDYSKTSTEIDDWFGLETPTLMLASLGLYLLLIYKVVPAYMKNRPAYELKTFITVYNVAQVLACVYIVTETMRITSTKLFCFWKCTIFEKNTRTEYDFNRLTYFVYWLKFTELSETIVFVLRKKQNQVSFLHVFHHCATLSLVYLQLKWYRGGSALYPIFLNCNVHIIMYSYYLAAALCEKEFVKRLTPVKKSITTIQMIQFVLILLQAGVMWCRCDIPGGLVAYYSSAVCVIFYGFYDFYRKSYNESSLTPPPATVNGKIR